MTFPKNFVWGAATASYQIEGAATEDGKGTSIWDDFCTRPGVIRDGSNGNTACDHYHRYASDIALMQQLGLNGYRFSLAWTRILPNGIGKVNRAGIDFYDKIIDTLCEAGIEPYITLYHWDMPLDLYKKGALATRDFADWFGEYADVAGRAFSDRVKNWITINEPQCVINQGLLYGVHAPGEKLAWSKLYPMVHNLLLAHGMAVTALRAASSQLSIGIAAIGAPSIPESNSPEDIAAARTNMFTWSIQNPWHIALWTDPIFLGKYPDDMLTEAGKDMPTITQRDMDIISQPTDICFTNIYNGDVVRAQPDGSPQQIPYPAGKPVNQMGWPITPACLYWGSKFLYERYGKPVVISENGYCSPDVIDTDGKVHDTLRLNFTRDHLAELKRACADNIDVRGYFHWSLMDNFEWAEGYGPRFGMVHVDYATQVRTPKDSAWWYKDVIACNGENIS